MTLVKIIKIVNKTHFIKKLSFQRACHRNVFSTWVRVFLGKQRNNLMISNDLFPSWNVIGGGGKQ